MWIRSNSNTLFNIADASKIEIRSAPSNDGARWVVTANFSRTPDGAKTSSYARNNPDEVRIFTGTEEEEAREVLNLVHNGFVNNLNLLDLSDRQQPED